MTISTALTAILKSFGVFSILLMIGSFLRAKIPVFQKLYLPACVIGGFVGLFFGPNVFGLVPFSGNTMAVASALPNILIIPVLSAIPMCMKFRGIVGGNPLKKSNDVLVLSFLEFVFLLLQMAVGCGVTALCAVLGAKTFPSMGLEMGMGFSGGHGTAASLGSTFEQLGDPWWEVAQGSAMTTATAGMIGGIVLGIIFINYAARKGYTTQIKSAAQTPKEMRVGFYKLSDERPSLGIQTTVSNNIETLTLHLGLLMIASLGAYFLAYLGKATGISIMGSLPTWLYGMVAMMFLWGGVSALKLEYLFDETAKNKITGLLSDYLIVAAIMSIPVQIVATYWITLLAVIVAGLVLTPLINWFVCKKLLRTNWFEKSLGMLGANTGVFVTGMLLIKMADPDLKSDALNDYSLGYTFGSLVLMPFMAVAMTTAVTRGTVAAFVYTGLVSVSGMILMLILQRVLFGKKTAKE